MKQSEYYTSDNSGWACFGLSKHSLLRYSESGAICERAVQFDVHSLRKIDSLIVLESTICSIKKILRHEKARRARYAQDTLAAFYFGLIFIPVISLSGRILKPLTKVWFVLGRACIQFFFYTTSSRVGKTNGKVAEAIYFKSIFTGIVKGETISACFCFLIICVISAASPSDMRVQAAPATNFTK